MPGIAGLDIVRLRHRWFCMLMKIIFIINQTTFQDCRVHVYAFFRQPFSEWLYPHYRIDLHVINCLYVLMYVHFPANFFKILDWFSAINSIQQYVHSLQIRHLTPHSSLQCFTFRFSYKKKK